MQWRRKQRFRCCGTFKSTKNLACGSSVDAGPRNRTGQLLEGQPHAPSVPVSHTTPRLHLRDFVSDS
jgi:hypothetical protein